MSVTFTMSFFFFPSYILCGLELGPRLGVTSVTLLTKLCSSLIIIVLFGFRVGEGDHTVEVRREGCRAEPTSVTMGFGGTRVVLMAVPDSDYRDGDSGCVLRLEY